MPPSCVLGWPRKPGDRWPSPRSHQATSLSARTVERKIHLPLATPVDVQAHASAYPAEIAIVRVLNRERRKRGIQALQLSPRLARAARNHTLDQLRNDRLDHTSSDGTPSAVRIRRVVRARASGETIAFASRGAGSGARTIVRIWLRSPAHASVLLSPRFRRIGIGRQKGRLGSAPGVVVTADLTSRQ